MIPGILGKKIGMTQIFEEDGGRVSVTVLEVGPCLVQAVKAGGKDGYNAVQIGYDTAKEKRVKKPQREYLKANKLEFKKFVKEIRCTEAPDVKVGDEITNKLFQKGDFVDISGRSKGKGFQGGMKRHNWSGGPASHGSKSHRVPGSIGASSYPSRVFKGQTMPGHMGSEAVTVQNIEIIDVNTDNNTIAVKGAVPGASGTYLVIKFALKKPLASREEVIEETSEQAETPEVPLDSARDRQEPKKEEAKEVKKEEAKKPKEETKK